MTLPPLTYEWYWIRYEKNTALPRDQEWSDAMLPYREARGGLAAVRAQGVRYVLLSSFNRDAYRRPWLRALYPELAAFYDEVERDAVLLRCAAPARGHAQGPELALYGLGTAP